jgi:hypothetical protein
MGNVKPGMGKIATQYSRFQHTLEVEKLRQRLVLDVFVCGEVRRERGP